MAYCSTADVRAITNLTTDEISDASINSLIEYATYELNADIGVTMYIPLNDINYVVGDTDDSNTEFSLKFCPIGDLNNDGTVDTNDIEVWSKLSSEDHYAKMNNPISSIDDDEIGKITFSSAPSTQRDYIVKYVWFPIPFDHPLIKKACVELTAYLCFLKVNLYDVSSYRIGKVSVTKTARHPGLVSFYDRYQQTLGRIRGRTLLRPVSWEMVSKMAMELEERLTYAGPGVPQQLLKGENP